MTFISLRKRQEGLQSREKRMVSPWKKTKKTKKNKKKHKEFVLKSWLVPNKYS